LFQLIWQLLHKIELSYCSSLCYFDIIKQIHYKFQMLTSQYKKQINLPVGNANEIDTIDLIPTHFYVP
jgi:hypothetical protein